MPASSSRMKRLLPYFLIAPTVIWYGVFWAQPVIRAFITSFRPPDGGWGVENYAAIFQDQYFTQALVNTGIIVIFSVFLEFILAFGLALLINKKFKGSGILLFIATIPMALPFVAVAAMWKAGLATYGWLNSFFFHIGLIEEGGKIVFLSGERWRSLILIIIIDAWGVIPSVMVILVAGMQNLNEEFKEAARVFGARKFQVLRKITFPLLKSTITTALILRLISAIQIWAIVTLMFGYLRLPTLVEQLVYYYNNRGVADPVYRIRAMAYSVLVAAIVSVVSIAYLRVSGAIGGKKKEVAA